MSRFTRAPAALMLGLLATSSAEATPLRDGSFSIDLGPDVCVVRPASLRDDAACATFEPDKIPVGQMEAPGVTALVFGVFPIGSGAERKMGAVTVVREEARKFEPTVATATQTFEQTAKEMAVTLSPSRPLQVRDVRVDRTNGLTVARCEIVQDDPARADALLARMAVSLVYADNGLYTITLSTPLAGAERADQIRERVFASLHGEVPRTSASSELGYIVPRAAMWIVGTVGLVALVRWLTRRNKRSTPTAG